MSQVPSPIAPVFDGGGTILLPPPGASSVQFSNSQSSQPGIAPTQVFGTDGADILSFSSATTGIEITAAGGNDSILGGSGDDVIAAGEGADTVFGGAGNDQIFGGQGNDLIFGGEGDDRIEAGDGDDVVAGGAGADTIFGGAGADSISGDDGDDLIFGNQDADLLQGGAGNDVIYGGQGADTIQGGSGNDTLFGDKGNDRLEDTAGGTDAFGFSYAGADDADTVIGFEAGTDKILLVGDVFASLGASVEDSEFTAVDAESQRGDADTPLVYVRETGELYFEGELVATFAEVPDITTGEFELF
ncbi:MAG: calcium-binding protein [Oscillatoriales cyanobacterium SM2_3_0]|nr:calcium-binding protein [Oscillatoriales cyanobacterium SM2_3_0]